MPEEYRTRSLNSNTKHACARVDAGILVVGTGLNGPVSGQPHELVPIVHANNSDRLAHAADNAVSLTRGELPERMGPIAARAGDDHGPGVNPGRGA